MGTVGQPGRGGNNGPTLENRTHRWRVHTSRVVSRRLGSIFTRFQIQPMGNDGAEQRRVVLRVGEQRLEARDAAQPAARRLAHQLAFVARIRNKISRFLA